MLTSLMLAALLMGVGGAPHCAAMCGAACSVVFPRGVPLWSLLGRCLSYALLGAVAAASAGLVSGWGRELAFVQPFWVMAQAAAFCLGLWLLFTGRMPAALESLGQSTFQRARQWWLRRRALGGGAVSSAGASSGWPLQLLGGMAWALLPCGLLYAALMTAALASSPLEGGLVMLCFALPGAVGVWSAPALLAKLRRRRAAAVGTPVPVIWMRAEGGVDPLPASGACAAPLAERGQERLPDADDIRWAVRLSGGLLAAMSAYGAYHLLWMKWQAWCA